MDETPVGLAMRITDSNRQALAALNGGVVPVREDVPTVFVMIYSTKRIIREIMALHEFFDHYKWTEPLNESFFVEFYTR